jgi:hypothetical protein
MNYTENGPKGRFLLYFAISTWQNAKFSCACEKKAVLLRRILKYKSTSLLWHDSYNTEL